MRRLIISFVAITLLLFSIFIPNCLAETTWQAIGPFGGKFTTIAIDPTNSQIVYAGTSGSGVFKSTNGSASWVAVNNGLTGTLVECLIIDPNNSQIIYAGTDYGVYKTTNSGMSWKLVNNGLGNSYVNFLAIDLSNSDILYAVTYEGILKSIDGGASWTVINISWGKYVKCLAIDKANSQIIYAGAVGTWTISDSGEWQQLCKGGVYKSTDGGISWAEVDDGITAEMDVWSLVVDPADSKTVYAGLQGGGVFKTVNSGALWTAVNNNLNKIVNFLASDPNNNRTIYAGTNGGVFKTTNGGELWTEVNNGTTDYSVKSLAVSRDNSNTIYVGTFNGLFKTINGGKSWRAVNSGIMNRLVDSLAIDPSDSQIIYAGMAAQQNYPNLGGTVYKTTNGGVSWSSIDNGLPSDAYGECLAIDPNNSQTIFVGTGYRGIFKTTNGGNSWTAVNNGLTDKLVVGSLAIDPYDSQIIYAGTSKWISEFGSEASVYKTVNGGASWSVKNSGLPSNQRITSLSIDPTSSQTIYVGTWGGGVFKSINGGTSWATSNSGIKYTNVRSLSIDPTNSQTIYAGTWGSGVFKSTNGGASWTTAQSGMTNTYVTSLAIDPNSSQIIYAGTSGGAFKTVDGGSNWKTINSGIKSNTIVNSIVIALTDSQKVYAGTNVGVFKTLFSDDVPVITAATTATFIEGMSDTFSITASGWPAPEFSLSGTIPSGVSFDTTTGILSGTPATGTAGTYPLIITAMNGIPPDATHGVTLTVLPVTSLTVLISTPAGGTRPGSLSAITGTSSGTGLSRVEVQVTDDTYYLQSNGSFTLTPAWLPASGTTSWSLNTASVTWREGITYTISARASNGSTTSVPSSSTFTIVVPTSKTATILSLTLTPDSLRTGGSTTISGLLVKSDTTGVSGQTVTLIITPPSTAVNPNPAPIVTNLTTASTGAFTSGALSLFATAGVYMVQARFEGTSTLASSFTSDALAVTSPSGYAIIVTGKTSDNASLDWHTTSTDTIYSILVNKRGFLPENIQYLKSTTTNTVTKQQVQDAITVWAKNKLVASPAPLYLIMIDHGSSNGFILGADTLTPDQLKGYLDTLESDAQVIASGTITTHNRIIVMGTCFSGIFINLSKRGRIIITSSNNDEQSISGFSIYKNNITTYTGGDYFIDVLFNFLGRGDTLKDAFTQARDMVELRDPRKVSAGTHADVYDTLAQHPLMDDNGDTRASYILGTDGLLAVNLRLGVGIRSLNNPADITAVTLTTTIPATQTTETPLWLRVNDNSRIAAAWMEIRTPITEVSSSGSTGQVIPDLEILPLYYDGLQWNGSYNFPNAGKYNILYYTQDNQTNDIAPAKNSVVYKEMLDNPSPSSFSLTSPRDGDGVGPMFPLTWQTVTSQNKITYTLKVATDQNFANVIYQEENIPQAATYMPKNALKKPGTNQYHCQNGDSFCHWKITAVDNYGATTDSNTRSFTIVSTSAYPGIIVGKIAPAFAGVSITTSGNGSAISLPNGYFLMSHLAGSFTLTTTATGYNVSATPIAVGELAVTNVTIALTAASVITNIPGDLDGDGAVTVADAIIALQVMAGMQPTNLRTDFATSGADIDGDGKITQSELLYILQKTAGAR